MPRAWLQYLPIKRLHELSTRDRNRKRKFREVTSCAIDEIWPTGSRQPDNFITRTTRSWNIVGGLLFSPCLFMPMILVHIPSFVSPRCSSSFFSSCTDRSCRTFARDDNASEPRIQKESLLLRIKGFWPQKKIRVYNYYIYIKPTILYTRIFSGIRSDLL